MDRDLQLVLGPGGLSIGTPTICDPQRGVCAELLTALELLRGADLAFGAKTQQTLKLLETKGLHARAGCSAQGW